MDELILYIREAVDRKQENMRRRKRRDALRLQLIRVLDLIAEFGTFGIRLVHKLYLNYYFVAKNPLLRTATSDYLPISESVN